MSNFFKAFVAECKSNIQGRAVFEGEAGLSEVNFLTDHLNEKMRVFGFDKVQVNLEMSESQLFVKGDESSLIENGDGHLIVFDIVSDGGQGLIFDFNHSIERVG